MTGGGFTSRPTVMVGDMSDVSARRPRELFGSARSEGDRGCASPSRLGFTLPVARWFADTFPEGPTEAQAAAWPALRRRTNTLVSAPTGSGKTLAGFLVAIDDLYRKAAAGEATCGVRVVYVSPLRALTVDVAQNLERPLAGIREVARETGSPDPEITVAVRTGDTPAPAREAMLRRPPTFLVTTPESLYLLLTAERPRQMLATVEWVIVDELHAVAGDKRGAHLALSLERLSELCEREPVRVGLSATQRPLEEMAALLVGERRRSDGTLDCKVVDVGADRRPRLTVEIPGGGIDSLASHSMMGAVLDRVAELVSTHRTTLVFVNTRRMAERVAHELAERLEEGTVAAHHGSLSKRRREQVETQLRAGELRALVATASLELGIDVGPVDLVCQIGTPGAISTLVQRVGRSNHHRHGTPEGVLFPLSLAELAESVALLRAVERGGLECVRPPEAPMDVLMQQIVAEASCRRWRTDELYRVFRRAYHYRRLDRRAFDEAVAVCSEGILTGRGPRARWLHHDPVNGEIAGRRGARLAAITSGGAIPETGEVRVVCQPEGVVVGTVDEDWASEVLSGDVFLLGTHAWRVLRGEGGDLHVVDAEGAEPTVPFWFGEAPGRSRELADQLAGLFDELAEGIRRGGAEAAVRALTEQTGVGEDVARVLVGWLERALGELGVLPGRRRLVVERFFDDTGGMQLLIHTLAGARVNRALGYALRKKFCRTFDFELQATATDDSVLLSLSPRHSFPVGEITRFLAAAELRETLEQAVVDQPLFQTRWRWVANRSLAVLRWRSGRRRPPYLQRMEADDLLAAVFPAALACQENVVRPVEIPEHPLVREAMDECLSDAMDLDGFADLWRRVESGEVEVVARDTTAPSSLAEPVLVARPYAFLDGGEAIDRRTRAVRRRPDTPGVGSLVRLEDDLVEEVVAEARPDPRDADELVDALRDMVFVEPVERLRPLFDQAASAGRVGEGELFGRVVWYATDRVDVLEALRRGEAEATAMAVAGLLSAAPPLGAEEIAGRLRLGRSQVDAALSLLEAQGRVVCGSFLPRAGESGPQWCDRRLLMRMHARSKKARRVVRPVPLDEYAAFLRRWQHASPGRRLRGVEGVLAVVEMLQGLDLPAWCWEAVVIPSRVDDFRPPMLDELAMCGELSWVRARPPATAADRRRPSAANRLTPISLLLREDRDWLVAAARRRDANPPPARGALADVVSALAEHGASFAEDLARWTGRLRSEVEEALWQGVARGLVTCDSFAPLRTLVAGRRPSRRRGQGSRSRAFGSVSSLLAGSGRRPSVGLRSGLGRGRFLAGRWELVTFPDPPPDPESLAEAVASQMLARWGVVFPDLARQDPLCFSWWDVRRALARLEDRGQVVAGRFVEGFPGEQFALPHALEQLKDAGRSAHADEGDSPGPRGGPHDPLRVVDRLLGGPRSPVAVPSETPS